MADAVLAAIAEQNGRIGNVQFLVNRLGLRTRHQLARILRSEGLPGIEELTAWVSVLAWLLEAETSGTSLFKVAHAADVDPATCYRIVKRATGRPWSELRILGVDWVMLTLRQRCRSSRSADAGFARAQVPGPVPASG